MEDPRTGLRKVASSKKSPTRREGSTRPTKDNTPWTKASSIRKAAKRMDTWFELTRNKKGGDQLQSMRMEVSEIKSRQETQTKVLGVKDRRLLTLAELVFCPAVKDGHQKSKGSLKMSSVENDRKHRADKAGLEKETMDRMEKLWSSINKTTVSASALTLSGLPDNRANVRTTSTCVGAGSTKMTGGVNIHKIRARRVAPCPISSSTIEEIPHPRSRARNSQQCIISEREIMSLFNRDICVQTSCGGDESETEEKSEQRVGEDRQESDAHGQKLGKKSKWLRWCRQELLYTVVL